MATQKTKIAAADALVGLWAVALASLYCSPRLFLRASCSFPGALLLTFPFIARGSRLEVDWADRGRARRRGADLRRSGDRLMLTRQLVIQPQTPRIQRQHQRNAGISPRRRRLHEISQTIEV
jgi:hypothetical protein